MKSLTQFIQEKLIIKKNKAVNYKYFPKTREELKNLVLQRIKSEGDEIDLNDIDVSNVSDMSALFGLTDFNGDISHWDVSNVTDMGGMFYGCSKFNQDISHWDVSKVKTMNYIFSNCPIEEKYKPKFK